MTLRRRWARAVCADEDDRALLRFESASEQFVEFERTDVAGGTWRTRPAALVGRERLAIEVPALEAACDHVARGQDRHRLSRSTVVLERAQLVRRANNGRIALASRGSNAHAGHPI